MLCHLTEHCVTLRYITSSYRMALYRILGLGIIGKVGKAAEESGVSIHAVLQVRTRTYCVVLCCVVLCCVVLYCIALYCIVLYCVVLYCVVLCVVVFL